ncbi:MAG: hypothetical protein KatS3mg103_1249 [Phycisphaerales bacterium]|nr:MAG: hypothetical protein KatS3mg103_1249 [Phycisphaerales bacterium]
MSLPPIELEKDPTPPPLRDSVCYQPTSEDALACLAQDLTMQAHACVRELGGFHLAVSGGADPRPLERLCRELMTDPAYRALPWSHTHVWTIDETPAAGSPSGRVFGVLRDLLIGHSGIPRDQVHAMSAYRPAADSEYERTLRRVLGARKPGHDRLDMAILALGPDGTAGRLHRDHAQDDARLVVRLPDQALTLTWRMLAGSRFLGVLALGRDVAQAVDRTARGLLSPVPTLLAGHTRWYVDHDAASLACGAPTPSASPAQASGRPGAGSRAADAPMPGQPCRHDGRVGEGGS